MTSIEKKQGNPRDQKLENFKSALESLSHEDKQRLLKALGLGETVDLHDLCLKIEQFVYNNESDTRAKKLQSALDSIYDAAEDVDDLEAYELASVGSQLDSFLKTAGPEVLAITNQASEVTKAVTVTTRESALGVMEGGEILRSVSSTLARLKGVVRTLMEKFNKEEFAKIGAVSKTMIEVELEAINVEAEALRKYQAMLPTSHPAQAQIQSNLAIVDTINEKIEHTALRPEAFEVNMKALIDEVLDIEGETWNAYLKEYEQDLKKLESSIDKLTTQNRALEAMVEEQFKKVIAAPSRAYLQVIHTLWGNENNEDLQDALEAIQETLKGFVDKRNEIVAKVQESNPELLKGAELLSYDAYIEELNNQKGFYRVYLKDGERREKFHRMNKYVGETAETIVDASKAFADEVDAVFQ